MSKRERKRILRNVKQMYLDTLKYKVGGKKTVALDGLCVMLATFFNIPRNITQEWKAKNKDVWDLYLEINGTIGIRGDER